jgi:hypothetical protein
MYLVSATSQTDCSDVEQKCNSLLWWLPNLTDACMEEWKYNDRFSCISNFIVLGACYLQFLSVRYNS